MTFLLGGLMATAHQRKMRKRRPISRMQAMNLRARRHPMTRNHPPLAYSGFQDSSVHDDQVAKKIRANLQRTKALFRHL